MNKLQDLITDLLEKGVAPDEIRNRVELTIAEYERQYPYDSEADDDY